MEEAKDVLDVHEQLTASRFVRRCCAQTSLIARTGGKVFVKCENLQRSGAFKFRGAYNCLSRLDRNVYPGGVVAYSAPLGSIATMEACERSSHSDQLWIE